MSTSIADYLVSLPQSVVSKQFIQEYNPSFSIDPGMFNSYELQKKVVSTPNYLAELDKLLHDRASGDCVRDWWDCVQAGRHSRVIRRQFTYSTMISDVGKPSVVIVRGYRMFYVDLFSGYQLMSGYCPDRNRLIGWSPPEIHKMLRGTGNIRLPQILPDSRNHVYPLRADDSIILGLCHSLSPPKRDRPIHEEIEIIVAAHPRNGSQSRASNGARQLEKVDDSVVAMVRLLRRTLSKEDINEIIDRMDIPYSLIGEAFKHIDKFRTE